jgi:hypothetical protein
MGAGPAAERGFGVRDLVPPAVIPAPRARGLIERGHHDWARCDARGSGHPCQGEPGHRARNARADDTIGDDELAPDQHRLPDRTKVCSHGTPTTPLQTETRSPKARAAIRAAPGRWHASVRSPSDGDAADAGRKAAPQPRLCSDSRDRRGRGARALARIRASDSRDGDRCSPCTAARAPASDSTRGGDGG